MTLHNIFDAHAHYDDKWFDEDRSALLSSMPENGVSYIVNAAVDIATAKTAIGYTEQYPHLYACAGIHPENLDGLEDDYLDQLTELLRHPKVVALGEIGLDYHWDIEKPLQQRVFEEQLRLAKELSEGTLTEVVPDMALVGREDDEISRKITAMFSLTLSKPEDEIGYDADFFVDLGGSSLDYFSLVAGLRDEFGVSFTSGDMSRSTVRALHDYIQEKM